MPSYTKAQIQNFLANKSADAWRGATTPQEASTRFLLLRFIKICVDNDLITPAQVNAAFPEFP